LRALLSGQIFVVNTTADTTGGGTAGPGPLTLRQAILDANAAGGSNTIDFNIGNVGSVQTIFPLSPLPTITSPVVIDGWSQGVPGYTGPPLIDINGTNAGGGTAGLVTTANDSTIRGLAINQFSGDGIAIEEPGGGNTIEANYIGTDATGERAQGNGGAGVDILGSSNNTIGGTTPGTGNVISGNGDGGIIIGFNPPNASPPNNNLIVGNFIGTDALGQTAISNLYGVLLSGGTFNTIGGMTHVSSNLISGNSLGGIFVGDGSDTNTLIVGNKIGTNASGESPIGNLYGVGIGGGTSNTIGGTTAGAGNLISGNATAGIEIYSSQIIPPTGNLIEGNDIGTDGTAMRAVGNQTGVEIDSGATANTIGGTIAAASNIISGNATEGVRISGAGTSDNTVEGNDIGTDGTAMKAVGNETGVGIDSGATANIIGGTIAASRNIISGNTGDGVRISGAGTTGNTVEGDLIGICQCGSGPAPLGNDTGVEIDSGATANLIGGTVAGARNIISSNTTNGVRFDGAGTTGNVVEGDFLGTAVSGQTPLGNDTGVEIDTGATANLVGGVVAAASNVVSGNLTAGVAISGAGTTGNMIEGNTIGAGVSGQSPLPNGTGVAIFFGATANVIGGTIGVTGNLISGNLNAGVAISGAGTSGNMVEGNTIGAGISGQTLLPNDTGVAIFMGATANVVGGSIGVTGNLISGNANAGVAISGAGTSGNVIEGNTIGAGVSGQTPLPNDTGVTIFSGATANMIGGSIAAARNIIAGNTGVGVFISGPGASGNTVAGNYIGTDLTGQLAVGNGIGVLVTGGSATTIGGLTAMPGLGAGNVISGNFTAGIDVDGAAAGGTRIEGNLIGTDWKGTAAVVRTSQTDPLQALQNAGVAIISSQGNTIGGTNPDARNVISGNYVGVNLALISGSGNPTNRVLGNWIGTDASGENPLGNIVGIYINGAAGNVVGGSGTGSANVVSGNSSVGVEILGSGSTGNLIQGNLIGPAANGQGAFVGRGGLFIQTDGIFIQDASGNTIGGSSSGTGNTISGNNAAGVFIVSLSGVSQGNTIQGNLIGLSQSDSPTLPNAGYGILLANARNNSIVLTGAAANQFGRNGIENIRIYQGPLRPSLVAARTSVRRSHGFGRGSVRAAKHSG